MSESELQRRISEFIASLPQDLIDRARKENIEHKKHVREKYRERHNEYYRYYRKLLKKAEEGISEEELLLVKKFYDDCPSDMWVDHIIPISRGGKHCVGNLQYLPPIENIKKGNKLPGEEQGTLPNRCKERFEA